MLRIQNNGGVTLQVTNNIPRFLNMFRFNCHRTLTLIGQFGKNKMDYYVAVDTGYLKSRNMFQVTIFGKNLIFGNDCYYAVYQEFGTYKMKAHPFIRPAFYNHINEIAEIARGSMSYGIN